MRLTIREDDVGRWWSLRRVLIGLSSCAKELVRYPGGRNPCVNFSRPKKKKKMKKIRNSMSTVPWGDVGIFFCLLYR